MSHGARKKFSAPKSISADQSALCATNGAAIRRSPCHIEGDASIAGRGKPASRQSGKHFRPSSPKARITKLCSLKGPFTRHFPSQWASTSDSKALTALGSRTIQIASGLNKTRHPERLASFASGSMSNGLSASLRGAAAFGATYRRQSTTNRRLISSGCARNNFLFSRTAPEIGVQISRLADCVTSRKAD